MECRVPFLSNVLWGFALLEHGCGDLPEAVFSWIILPESNMAWGATVSYLNGVDSAFLIDFAAVLCGCELMRGEVSVLLLIENFAFGVVDEPVAY